MNITDKISKEVLNILDYSKEVVKTNLVTANDSKTFESLNSEQLERIVNVVNLSLSQGFQKALPNFQKAVDGLIPSYHYSENQSRKKK